MDYNLGDTIYLPFTTRAFATGIPTVLAGTPAIDIYEDASTTQVVTGETLTVSLDSVVGFNMITITATAATGFEAGKSYTAVIQAGTVGGVSVVGEVVGHFTLNKSAAYKTMVVAGAESLVVDSGTSTTIVDAALTQADNFWIGAQIQMLSGTAGNIGLVRTVTDFVASTDTLTFSPALPAATAAADTYRILAGNFGVIEVDANNRVDVGAFAGTAVTAGDPVALANSIVAAVITNAAGTDVAADIIALDAVADAIKVITDQMVFTKANELDVNTQSINGAGVVGDGNATPWDGA